MKTSYVIGTAILCFVVGYATHGLVDESRVENHRAELEAYYRSKFQIGEDFDKVAAPLRDNGLGMRFIPEFRRYDASLPADRSARLKLYVEIDENRRIKSVVVARVILI